VGTRIKTFNSTGVAPNGRLYAGDLNLIQDQYADQSNFLQTIDTATIRVGDSSIQILKYGTAELRASAALRVDGILRGLGGLYAGAFTTAQRDAIAAGFRPFGLVILNTTNTRYEWNRGTDAAPVWAGIGSGAVIGTLGSRPAATPANAESIYFATDDNGGTWYYSDGTTWIRTSNGLNAISKGTLSVRPVAGGVFPGTVYVATDDHGGTSWESDGSTWQKMGASIYGEWPIGGVMDWPYLAAGVPPQSLLPYGQAVPRTAYPELHALAQAAGYVHGAGDGSTTFNLPDYRGRVGIGKDDMGGTAANRITAAISGIVGTTLGQAGGAEGITLTTAQIPAHAHADAGHAHTYTAPQGPVGKTDGGQSAVPNVSPGTATSVAFAAIQNTGGGGAHANVQPSIVVNKVMRAL
jgi:microcystin-dependent protein